MGGPRRAPASSAAQRQAGGPPRLRSTRHPEVSVPVAAAELGSPRRGGGDRGGSLWARGWAGPAPGERGPRRRLLSAPRWARCSGVRRSPGSALRPGRAVPLRPHAEGGKEGFSAAEGGNPARSRFLPTGSAGRFPAGASPLTRGGARSGGGGRRGDGEPAVPHRGRPVPVRYCCCCSGHSCGLPGSCVPSRPPSSRRSWWSR